MIALLSLLFEHLALEELTFNYRWQEYGSRIAYQIRFESSKTMATDVLFLTEGVLLRY